MSSDNQTGGGPDERRTLLIGAVIAILLLALIVITVIRFLTPDERLLVLRPDGSVRVQEGDLVRVTGVVRRLARGFDAQAPGDTGGDNALLASSIAEVGRDAESSSVSATQVRNQGRRRGDRVTIVGEVDEVLNDDFLTLVDD